MVLPCLMNYVSSIIFLSSMLLIMIRMLCLLTSGFEYLTNPMKEISYIVRPIQVNRLIRK